MLWTDLATWRGPTPNHGGPMLEQRGLVIHIAEGSYEGTIAWQKNPAAQVSSHFVTDFDGKTAQVVDTDVTAWTQQAGNGHWLSVENAGHTPNALTAAQCEAIAQLFARGHQAYGWPLQLATGSSGRGLGHHSMGGTAWGHLDCPGPNVIAQKPAILARAIQILGGGPPPVPARSTDMGYFFGDETGTQYFADSSFERYWVFGAPGTATADWHAALAAAGNPPVGTAQHAKVLAGFYGENQGNWVAGRTPPAGGGGGSGPTAADIAKAVNDDAAARLAD